MASYETDVFINCPFGLPEYWERLQAIVFTIHRCGFRARCALELDDGATTRATKLFSIIRECKLGIHDISYVQPDPDTGFPRFNMPLELGFFLGAKQYGKGKQRDKIALILDTERYRYQSFCSDIAGQDIRAHEGSAEKAVGCVRRWLRNQSDAEKLPGETKVWEQYQEFRENLPILAAALDLDLDKDELQFNDYTTMVVEWLKT